MGKNKYIETPAAMWDYFLLYKIEVKANPINIVEQKKGNTILPKDFKGEIPDGLIKLPAQRPLTMEGFENWLSDNDILVEATDYFENKGGRYADYAPICTRIRKNIRQDQIEGGMVGIYNASITQRLNSLKESVDATVTKRVFKIGYKKSDEGED